MPCCYAISLMPKLRYKLKLSYSKEKIRKITSEFLGYIYCFKRNINALPFSHSFVVGGTNVLLFGGERNLIINEDHHQLSREGKITI
jgi:hypothetical protein